MAVTDHDTTAAVEDVRELASARGIEAIAGIEITAIEQGRDVHVLGYFFDPAHHRLQAFLAEQRRARAARIEAMAARLAELGMPVDVGRLVDTGHLAEGRSLGRPLIARALVQAGHVASTDEAFDRWLERGRPAFVPRRGPSPEDVIHTIHAAGGLASLAHPGKGALTPRIPSLAAAGLDAIEAYHPDHDETATAGLVSLARELGVCVTGGSDFHGDPARGRNPGTVALPPDEFERLRSAWPHAAR